MLVLSRKCGERLCIADSIEVTVISVQGGRVRLGITAPAEVSIHRAEVQRRVDHKRFAPDLAAVPSSLFVEGATTCP